MPEHVQPSRGLGSGAEPAGGREYTREGKRVRESNEGGEQVAAGEDKQRPRPQEVELTEQQDRRDQIKNMLTGCRRASSAMQFGRSGRRICVRKKDTAGSRNSGREQYRELLRRHRPAEIVSLCLVALVGPKKCQFFHRLHALRNDPQLEAAGHGDHCGHNGRIVAALLIWRTNDWSILRASTGNFRR